jgi:amidase
MGASESAIDMPRCRGVDIEDLSIQQLQDHLAKQSFNSHDLTKCYLKRIELLNPRVKAVIETNPDALRIADELDAERKSGKVRSKIHGIPFLVKDNMATRDKMETTAGCRALVGTVVPSDATVVERLRASGGVLLGKANLSEWASMRASHYSEAYSSRGGQNRNPYNLAEHPGGSSSGSASALAANMCAFSIGTETDGSVMFPADRNAVVGIKPTVGLTSTSGVIPESPSMDTVGTFGRSIEDATVVLDIIADKPNSRVHRDGSYTSSLAKKDALKGAKFGLPSKRVWESAAKSTKHKSEYVALQEVIKQLEEAGVEILEAYFPSAEEIVPPCGWDWTYAEGKSGSKLSEFEVVKVEFYQSLAKYLGTLENNENKILSLEDVVAYNIKHTDTEGGVPGTHPAWPTGQDSFDRAVEAKDGDEADYQRALEYIQQKSRVEGIDAALEHAEAGSLDGLLVPLQADGGVACSVAAKAGYPMITIPVGVNDCGVPFGLGIIQTAWKEDSLIKFGSAIEDLLRRPRARPKFLNFDADNYPLIGKPPSEAGGK